VLPLNYTLCDIKAPKTFVGMLRGKKFQGVPSCKSRLLNGSASVHQ
jgi:hypothetical protein